MNTSDLDDIAPVIGYRATRIIAVWFGGSHLWVPTKATPGHRLGVLLGMPALRALVRAFGGKRLRVPTGSDERRYARNRQIALLIARGMPLTRIATRMGMTLRRVEQIRAELVREGWLQYAQGFAPGTDYPRGRRHLSRPEILGTGENPAEPPGGTSGGSPELKRALDTLLAA